MCHRLHLQPVVFFRIRVDRYLKMWYSKRIIALMKRVHIIPVIESTRVV